MPGTRVSGLHDEEADDAALVRAAQANPEAFSGLYARYMQRVYRYHRARVPADEEAADLTQQTFLQALDALPRYQERGLPFAAWLFRIARNAGTDAHRRRTGELGWELLPETAHPASAGEDPEQLALRRETLQELREQLAALDAEKRELLALRFAGGLTMREIGAVVGKSEQAVKKALARTLAGLRELYDDP